MCSKGFLPLDPKLYNLSDEQLDFLRSLTGFENDDEMRQHVLTIQAQAYEICPCPCVRSFTFAKLPIIRIPYYDRALALGRKNKDAIFLDLGCCFGSDSRKAVFDGWPADKVIASDLHQELWELGHELYRSTPTTFPAGFIPGDVFDPQILSSNPTPTPRPPKPTNLTSLTSLNSLKAHISIIHTSLFFHLFNEDQQLDLAHRVATLLSPEKGSMIFGGHYGRQTKGTTVAEALPDGTVRPKFRHSPESWKSVWEEVFGEASVDGRVKIEVEWEVSKQYQNMDVENQEAYYWMVWCVTRL